MQRFNVSPKNPFTVMKTTTRFPFIHKAMLFGFVCATLLFSACSDKKDNPQPANAPVDLPSNVVGTFTGDVSYTSGSGIPIANAGDGTATLTKTGDKTYSISFSDGVPAVTNLKFKTASGGSYSSIDSDGSTAGMELSASRLSVGVTKGSQTWGFAGTK